MQVEGLQSKGYDPPAKSIASRLSLSIKDSDTAGSKVKGNVDDFVKHFRNRFRRQRDTLLGIRSRAEGVYALKETKSGMTGREFRVIGMVYEKRVTKNGHLLIEIEDEEEFLAKEKQMSPEEKAAFEALLPDLKNIRRVKEGKVTIDELVSSIEKMLQGSKKTKDAGILRRERTKFELPFPDFDIEKAMEKIYNRISRSADSQGLVLFSRILKENMGTEGIVRTFIPCLFLTNRGRINMWQDVFFGEIFISLNAQPENPAASAAN